MPNSGEYLEKVTISNTEIGKEIMEHCSQVCTETLGATWKTELNDMVVSDKSIGSYECDLHNVGDIFKCNTCSRTHTSMPHGFDYLVKLIKPLEACAQCLMMLTRRYTCLLKAHPPRYLALHHHTLKVYIQHRRDYLAKHLSDTVVKNIRAYIPCETFV